ncbi:MAG: hypothetical protein LDL27_05140 [Desulfovibrio sp.]|jgi:hypothetical protein|nr:hypothetical protein [Desulfovibrio sp.]
MNPVQRSRRRKQCFTRLADLYSRMDAAYHAAAARVQFTCADCAHNCCVSHFQHHTMVEWAYFFEGFKTHSPEAQARFLSLAQANVTEVQRALALGETPQAMCPMNQEGLCGSYTHRFMICRLHGVAHVITPPGRETHAFPGCPRYEALAMTGAGDPMDRTPFYQELAAVDRAFRETLPGPRPKVDLTLSEMLLLGPPR